MEARIAKTISVLFHPMLMPLYAFFILFGSRSYFSSLLPWSVKLMIAGIIALNTILFPLVLFWLFRKKGLIHSYLMVNRDERTYPYLIMAVFYFITFYLLKNLQLPYLYGLFMLGATFLAIMALLVNFYWKISSHLIGTGGLLGTFLALHLRSVMDIPVMIMVLILVSGITGFARLKTDSHEPAQVYCGFFAGVIMMCSLFLLV